MPAADDDPPQLKPSPIPPASAGTASDGRWPVVFAIWLAFQLLILALSAGRVPLWARFPRPAEMLAVEMLLAGQIVASSLLFPLLLPRFSLAIAAIAACWPFIQLAGLLSHASQAHLIPATLVPSIWMFSLFVWSRARSERQQLFICAIASLIALGMPLIAYLRFEFSPHEPNHLLFGPIGLAIQQSSEGFSNLLAWLLLSILLVVGAGQCFWKCSRSLHLN